MRILVVAPSAPNRFHRIRLFNMVQALRTKHHIDVAYPPPKPAWLRYRDCLPDMFSSRPLEVAYSKSDTFRQTLVTNVNSYDAVIIKRLRAVQYLPEDINIPAVIDTTDAMSLFYRSLFKNARGLKRLLYFEEMVKYRWYEQWAGGKFKHWVVSSPADQDYLKQQIPDAKIHLVPNVVDTRHHKPAPTLPKNRTLLFSGLMDKFVNYQAADYFIQDVFPLIQASVPDVHLFIVGPNPPRRIRTRHDGVSISVTGRVSDIRDYINAARVVVVPVQSGAGTRNKILQAWAHAKPVVSTSIGHSGLTGTHGTHIMVADSAGKFAEETVKLLKDASRSEKIGNAARLLVEKEYSLPVLRNAYTTILNEITS